MGNFPPAKLHVGTKLPNQAHLITIKVSTLYPFASYDLRSKISKLESLF